MNYFYLFLFYFTNNQCLFVRSICVLHLVQRHRGESRITPRHGERVVLRQRGEGAAGTLQLTGGSLLNLVSQCVQFPLRHCWKGLRFVILLQLKELWEAGDITPKTRCWAQGMDGWRPLQNVPQLKWTLVATGTPVLNESELASLILKMLIKICECYPSRW